MIGRTWVDAKCEPTDAEQSKIADDIAIRGRIETMRSLLTKDERKIESRSQSTVAKARMEDIGSSKAQSFSRRRSYLNLEWLNYDRSIRPHRGHLG
ncbi:hypothetical protein [Agrobacterium vitis]|uniref:hypothetical protein n=1 Tax=Agrobacterium vitis TaxID=373 RepID=UPI0015735CE9|nr:hypothetical protein [Agrobacterium vitis]NSZ17093.1 hypothetical protein [Agrobacterium vitis]QZO02833.1 hypothetical protein K4831_10135 [Agrobacterium vitis]UJL87958.1 hypothetical protein AVF2S5_08475 [Agrobacterium vitis]